MAHLLQLGHSPDPDDAFMWWPLTADDGPFIDPGPYRFVAVLDDIESLNVRAESGELEITALSCAQAPRVQDVYALTACGASVGDGYGPKLVANRPMSMEELSRVTIAVPGERTSAFGGLCLMFGRDGFRYEVIPFDEIIDVVASGRFPAGLVIHEGQLTFADAGLHLVEDLGVWWRRRSGQPLPLGVNAIRRDLETRLGTGALVAVTTLLRRSVEHAMLHRAESIERALAYARGMDADRAAAFVDLYVNRWTLEFGEQGEAAVRAYLDALHEAGVTPAATRLDFIGAAVGEGGDRAG